MSTSIPAQVLVLAKAPQAGRVKTRLCPPFTHPQAAQLAAAALADTIDAVERAPIMHRVLVLDGDPARVGVPDSFDVVPQRGHGLDERLAAAFDDAFARRTLPLLVVGMDTPQLTSRLLTEALAALAAPGRDAVIGPTVDGGYWCLGLRRPDPALLLGVPMSTPWTYSAQVERLRAHGLAVEALAELRDVDTATDAWAVARATPGTRFAARLREIAFDSGAAS